MNPVASSLPIGQPGQTLAANPLSNKVGAAPGGSGFAKLVENFVAKTNETQVSSDKAIDDLVHGRTDNVEQVVLAVANAELSFQMFMEIRNKLIDSYNELMRMQF